MTTKQQSDNSINEEVEEEVCDNTRERRREIIEAKVERPRLDIPVRQGEVVIAAA